MSDSGDLFDGGADHSFDHHHDSGHADPFHTDPSHLPIDPLHPDHDHSFVHEPHELHIPPSGHEFPIDIPGITDHPVVTEAATQWEKIMDHPVNKTIHGVGAAIDGTMETAEHVAEGAEAVGMGKEVDKLLDKTVKTAESWASRFGKMHWGAKTAIIGGTVAVGAALGYWAFKSRNEKAENQQISGTSRA